jgi:anaerobic dimethyl sulfoxide reductase subunit A
MDYSLFPPNADGIAIIPTTCVHNCGGKCLLKAHVRNGQLLYITSDDDSDDASLLSPQLRACTKGRAMTRHLYHPDRLRTPLRRTGPRGSGQFAPVSWTDAIAETAAHLTRLKETYGDSAIVDMSSSGSFGGKFHQRTVNRFLHMFGCVTRLTGSYSSEATDVITEHMCGTGLTGNDRADLLNARLILMWGFNPAESMRGTNTAWFIARAREQGTQVIALDPMYTESAATLADEWIPIRPGTDAAVMIAMAYVMISENLHDAEFLETFTTGFPAYCAYVQGHEDGIPKTPAWAEEKSGVPADTIIRLARLYAREKPGALLCGWSLQRTAYGETPVRTAITLAAMTGNMGIPGGNVSGADYSRIPYMPGIPVPPPPDPTAEAPIYLWPDLILTGKAGGFPVDVHGAYICGGNLLNQGAHIEKNIRAMNKLELVVVHEQFMTPTARYADIIFPINTFLERNDICFPGTRQGNYFLYANQVVDSLYESKSDYETFCLLADALGFGPEYSDGKTAEDWLQEFVAESPIPDYLEFKRAGIWRDKRKKPYIAFTEQIQKGKPFATPSGKIEIYSQRLADLQDPENPAIPRYQDPWEGPADPLRTEYPLQLVTPHHALRVNSSLANHPWLQKLKPHGVWISQADAKMRGIEDGDRVRVFNQRGAVRIIAHVTSRIMPGVVTIYEGTWFDPDETGVDRAGSANVLCSNRPTPLAKASTSHTTLVDVASDPDGIIHTEGRKHYG